MNPDPKSPDHATATCLTCHGCDHPGCKAECHGTTFGVHVDWYTYEEDGK
jgi:hypothetical protein